jgi:hypothetical protein
VFGEQPHLAAVKQAGLGHGALPAAAAAAAAAAGRLVAALQDCCG